MHRYFLLNKKMSTKILNDKVLLVTNIPNPYRIPLFNELNSQFKERNIDFKVIFASTSESYRKWQLEMSDCQFNWEKLNSRSITISSSESIIYLYNGLVKLIKQENPNIVITIGFSFSTMILWMRSWFRKTKYIIWSGAIYNSHNPDSFLRRIQRKILIRRASAFIAYGKLAKDYLVSLGAPGNKTYIAINTVDTDYFGAETALKEIKCDNNPDPKILLFVGYFIERKRIDLLLHLVKNLLLKRKDFLLKLVGDGPDLSRMKELAITMGVEDAVVFDGYKQKNELPDYFAQSDCFLFPTEHDIWGLVLVEAMAAGIPCISSIKAGATNDIIINGFNGFALDFTDTTTVAEKVNYILDNPSAAKKLGQNAAAYITEHVNIQRSAIGFMDAVSCVSDSN
ncbi:glycosyltransferase family 4 protein [Acidobacteriota bacterium]